jgi:hypothetical protein
MRLTMTRPLAYTPAPDFGARALGFGFQGLDGFGFFRVSGFLEFWSYPLDGG